MILLSLSFCQGSSVEGNILRVKGSLSSVEGTLPRVPFDKKFLKRHSHAILVHFKNQKYVLTSMIAHK